MKKIIILLGVMILTINSVTAQEVKTNYCVVPKDVGSGFSKGISNITGANFIATKAIEIAIQREVKKQLGSKVNVELYPFTVGSLAQGKFKKMTIDSKKLNLDGFYISNFKAETVCGYNHIEISNDDILFKEDFGMNFSAKITNKDLISTMKSSQYMKLISNAKISFMGQTIFRVTSMTLNIKNNRLVIILKVVSPVMWGTNTKTFTATSGLKVVDGKIVYSNMYVKNTGVINDPQVLNKLISMINPFIYEINITKNSFGYTNLKNVIIENDEIIMDGNLFIPKNN